MAKKTIELPPQPKCTDNGSHHWILEPPNGPFSQGKCSICNKTYEHFSNLSLPTNWAASGSA